MNDWEKLQLLNKRKEELRAKMKEVRAGLGDESRAQQDKTLFNMITQTQLYEDAKWILCYVSFGTEVDTRELLKKAIHDGKRVFVPTVRDGAMDFFQIGSLDELTPGTIGIPEPDADPARAFPYDLHLSLDKAEECAIFVPGLAFDKECHRLGYGGGYYDKYLRKFDKKMTVGLSYSEQIVEEVPTGEKDVSLDLVVTPTGAFY